MSTDPTKQPFTQFEARIVTQGAHGEATYALFDPLNLVQYAVSLALLAHSPEEVDAAVRVGREKMLASLAHPRRQGADVVQLEAGMGFGVRDGLYRIEEGDEPRPCPLCNNPACQEWPNVERLTANGRRTGEYAYHVSECEMVDAPAGFKVQDDPQAPADS